RLHTASSSRRLGGQRGQSFADRGCELEAVPRAGRADDDAAAALEDEALVVRVGVEAGLGLDRLGIGIGMRAGNPLGDSLEQLGIGLPRLVGIDLPTRVVNAGLEPVPRV